MTRIGATYAGGGQTRFLVWAPFARTVDVHLTAPNDRLESMRPVGSSYFEAVLRANPGAKYFYRLDQRVERPDPASRFQPEGVHGPSEVVDENAFEWHDRGWFGIPLRDYVIYELHVGTFTPAGTFDALIPELPRLVDVGVTALELMPVAQFPGNRNWGYDGVFPFAVQTSYGGPDGLKRLVDACHATGLAVILDVVYNHLGPEGNYLADYGPYLTDRYRTPWGMAVNFDGPASDQVRRYFFENALSWISDYHIDALRLDAIHAIHDFSAIPFLQELAADVTDRAEQLNRRAYLIAESDLNDARIVRPTELGGFGLASQWSDDFHHAVHTLLTGESKGYYEDFGSVEALARAYREGFVYSGQYSPHRKRRHGSPAAGLRGEQFVVCIQNHDQVGNRMLGDRLSQLVSFEKLKLAAAAYLLSPFIPLIFMGEEYGETRPFQYFTSHTDPDLVEAVRRGRSNEFAAFRWQGEVPDPQAEATFNRSKLDRTKSDYGDQLVLRSFYQALLRLRRSTPAFSHLSKDDLVATALEWERVVVVRRWYQDSEVLLALNFSDVQQLPRIALPEGNWRKILDSADRKWSGSGTPTPDRLVSAGDVELALAGSAAAAFELESVR